MPCCKPSWGTTTSHCMRIGVFSLLLVFVGGGGRITLSQSKTDVAGSKGAGGGAPSQDIRSRLMAERASTSSGTVTSSSRTSADSSRPSKPSFFEEKSRQWQEQIKSRVCSVPFSLHSHINFCWVSLGGMGTLGEAIAIFFSVAFWLQHSPLLFQEPSYVWTLESPLVVSFVSGGIVG